MPPLLSRLRFLLGPGEGWRVVGIAAAAVLAALVQTASVAAIIPFMGALADPASGGGQLLPGPLEGLLAGREPRTRISVLGAGLLVLLVLANVLSAWATWTVTRFAWRKHHQLSTRLLRWYVHRPYPFFLGRNTAELGKNVLMEAHEVTRGVLVPLLDVTVRGTVALALLVFLLLLDGALALATFGVLGGGYGLVWLVVRRRQREIGEAQVEANTDRFRMAGEALVGIKEVKVLGREDEVVDRFARRSSDYARMTMRYHLTSDTPRYVMEVVAFGGAIALVVYLTATAQGLEEILPLMGAFVLAGYKLLPALQTVFGGLMALRFHSASVNALFRDLAASDLSLEELAEEGRGPDRGESAAGRAGPGRGFETRIELRDVGYRYPEAAKPSLRGVDLRIEKGGRVGIAGPTGSGKTTLVDLLLGLLEPTEGEIRVDGEPLTGEVRRAWRRGLGYVPQEIFIADDTVAANIALGLPDESVDRERLRAVVREAGLESVVDALPEGFHTRIGERGLRLSGGERQRIGIARALYGDPDVLVLDEATSALDGETEREVASALFREGSGRTILWIAHRLVTLRGCDVIHLFRDGRRAGSGTFDELMESSELFRAMAREREEESGA